MTRATAADRGDEGVTLVKTFIHRLRGDLKHPFRAPRNLTFAYQPARAGFMVWYREEEPMDCLYTIVGTGSPVTGDWELVASTVMPDGYEVYHLLRLTYAE